MAARSVVLLVTLVLLLGRLLYSLSPPAQYSAGIEQQGLKSGMELEAEIIAQPNRNLHPYNSVTFFSKLFWVEKDFSINSSLECETAQKAAKLSQSITPSLGVSTIIYPFHNFF